MNTEEKAVLKENQNKIASTLSRNPGAFNAVITELSENGLLNEYSKDEMLIVERDSPEAARMKVRKLNGNLAVSLETGCFAGFLRALENHGLNDLRNSLQAQYDAKTGSQHDPRTFTAVQPDQETRAAASVTTEQHTSK